MDSETNNRYRATPGQPRRPMNDIRASNRTPYSRFSSDGMVRSTPQPNQQKIQPQPLQSQTTLPSPQGPAPRPPEFNTSQRTAHDTPGLSTPTAAANPAQKRKRFSSKKLRRIGIGTAVVAVAIVATSIFTHSFALGEFKTIKYKVLKASYSISFYTKSAQKTINSDNTQLVSKVSKDNKFPITLSVESGDTSAYARLKECSGFTKVGEVANKHVKQNIAICDATKGQEDRVGLYVAGFVHNNQLHIITIGQDTGGSETTDNTSGKFGLTPYKEDILKIVSSINVK